MRLKELDIDTETELPQRPLAFESSGVRGPKIVLAHGFTQNRGCWGPFASELQAWARVTRVDLPGHGGSSAVTASVPEGAQLLGATGGRAHYLGYSMGGRHVLHLALDRPDLVQSAILIGAHPGIETPEAVDERRAWDRQMADRLEQIGVDAFLIEWLSLPLFSGLAPAATCLEARMQNGVAGLAASLRVAGTGSQQPLWSRMGELRPPTLFLAGERDEKYVMIGDRAQRVGSPAVQAQTVADAGHAAHLERPALVAALVKEWIQGSRSIVTPDLDS